MDGTSMASPNTAGVAAEVMSNFPELSVFEIKKKLMDSVTPIGRFSGKLATGGRVDLYKAITGQ